MKTAQFTMDRKLRFYVFQITVFSIFITYVLLSGGGTWAYWLRHRHIAFIVILHGFEWGHYLPWAFSYQELGVKYAWGLLFGWFIIATIPILRKIQSERRQYEQREDYASHGTSRFMNVQEVKRFFYRTQKGILLGSYDHDQYWPIHPDTFHDGKQQSKIKDKTRLVQAPSEFAVHPFDDELNNQYFVIGPPGSQKTTGFVLPNVFHQLDQGNTVIVTDPKGEVYRLTASYAKQRGYHIGVLDYIFFSYGNHLNTLQYIQSETDIKTIANVYMQGSKAKDEKDDFWASKAESLLVALIGYVLAVKGKDASWPDVYDCTVHPKLLDPETGPEMIAKAKLKGLSASEYRAFIRATEEVREGVIATLSSRLQNYGIEDVREQARFTDIDLYKLGYEPTILYVWISDSNTAFRAQSSVFWTTFFNTQYEAARKTGDKLAVTEIPIIEEMANIGRIGDYLTKLTTMRGRGIKPMHIWHSIPQLQDVYGKDQAEAFMAACDTTIVLGVNDLNTAKVLSELVGDTTIRIAGESQKSTAALNTNNETQNYQGRRLMQPSEIRAMENKFTLVIQRARPPVMLKKSQYKYWQQPICEPSELNTLLQYGKGIRYASDDQETDYSFIRGDSNEIAQTTFAEFIDDSDEATYEKLVDMIEAGKGEIE